MWRRRRPEPAEALGEAVHELEAAVREVKEAGVDLTAAVERLERAAGRRVRDA